MKRVAIALLFGGMAFGGAGVNSLNAQDISVPAVTTASPGAYANPLKLDTDRYDGEQRNRMRERGGTNSECSAEALPAADQRRMETEYVRRVGADGKASADAWVREQGRQFRLKLVAEGICPDPSGEAEIARNEQDEASEDGCRMVMRPVAGLGGAPMTMAMVPDCD